MKRRTTNAPKSVTHLCGHCNKQTKMKLVKVDPDLSFRYWYKCLQCMNDSTLDLPPEKSHMKAKTKWFKKAEGYGFIIEDDSKNVFVREDEEDKTLSHNVQTSTERRISVLIDPSTGSKQDIINALLCLSELYRSIGGDSLILRGRYVVTKELAAI